MAPPLQFHEQAAATERGAGDEPRHPPGPHVPERNPDLERAADAAGDRHEIPAGDHTGTRVEGRVTDLPADGSQWLVGPFDDTDQQCGGAAPTACDNFAPGDATADAAPQVPVGAVAALGAPETGLRVAVTAVHGGSGATTVAAMLRSQGVAVDELMPDSAPPGPGTVPLLVVRGDASGTHTLAGSLLGWRAWFGQKPLLVVVPDAPTGAPSRAARYRLRALAGDYTGPIHLPWLWPLREADSFEEVAATKKARRAAASLVDELHRHTQQTHPNQHTVKK